MGLAIVLNSSLNIFCSSLCSKFDLKSCRHILNFFKTYQELLKENEAYELHQDVFLIRCIQCLLVCLNGGFPSYLLEDLIVVYRNFYVYFPSRFEFWLTNALEGDIPSPTTKSKVKTDYLKQIM